MKFIIAVYFDIPESTHHFSSDSQTSTLFYSLLYDFLHKVYLFIFLSSTLFSQADH